MFKTQLRLQFIVFLWGFTGVLGKLISLSSLPLVFWRTLIATLSIFIFLKIVNISVRVTKKQLFYYLGIGAIIGLHWFSFFEAIKVSNVSVALSTLATGSLFTAFIEPIFFKRKINLYEVLLSAVVIVCIWLIFRASPEYILGIALGIFCSFLSALFAVLNAVLQKDETNKPRIIMLYEMLGALLFVFLILLFMGDLQSIQSMRGNDYIWILILGALFTAYPMIESVVLMKYISPFTLVLSVNLEPVYGIILAFFIFGESEKMSPIFYFATAVMIASLVVNGIVKQQLKKKKQSKITNS